MENRENFGSRYAVIMAMAGSAIGLGNIWRFPYMVGQGGGSAFIIVYLVSTLLISLPIFLAEAVIGRKTHKGTFGAMQELAPGTPWRWMGLLTVFSPLIILSYYSVVGGWSVEFLLKSLTFSFSHGEETEVMSFFGNFISSPWGPLACHTAFLGICALIVVAGVKKGIEKFSTWTMPLLLVLILFIMVYALTLPGSGAGVTYLVKPDFSKLTAGAIASAMGQSFFSLSLGVGTILTYASYVHKDEHLLFTGLGTAGFDLLFALIAGFAVMPAVFAAGIEPAAGPGLVFETLPYIFVKMGAGTPWLSGLVSILFFLTILVAAVSSAISMLEVGVAYLVEEKHFTRGKAVTLLFVCCWLLGALCSLSFGPLSNVKLLGETIFGFCDKLTSNFLMAFGGLLFTLFAGWRMSRVDVRSELRAGKAFGVLYFLIRYVASAAIVIIFLTNLFL
ncbi:MAG: sodium-dependent transporter [Bacteroidales bacterium]|nr:sodium-dependent transporter [Bacteroidales bacterium]